MLFCNTVKLQTRVNIAAEASLTGIAIASTAVRWEGKSMDPRFPVKPEARGGGGWGGVHPRTRIASGGAQGKLDKPQSAAGHRASPRSAPRMPGRQSKQGRSHTGCSYKPLNMGAHQVGGKGEQRSEVGTSMHPPHKPCQLTYTPSPPPHTWGMPMHPATLSPT